MMRFLLTVIIGLLAILFPLQAQAQLSEEQEADLTEDEVLTNEFFKGARVEDLSPRVYNCLWEQNQMIRAYNYTRDAWNLTDPILADNLFPTWQDRVYNVTELVSGEVADTWYNCLNAAHDTFIWWQDYSAQFNDTEKYYSYPVSVLQTALEQIVYMTKINMAMYDAAEVEDWRTFYFMAGRFTRMLLIVAPLPIETLDDLEDEAFGDDDVGKTDDDFDGGYTPYDGGDSANIAGDDDYDPYADVDSGDDWENKTDNDWENPNNEDWDDDWNSLIRLMVPKTLIAEASKMVGSPPDYLDADSMNIVYKILFFIEGFGSQTIGFSSSYYATGCGEVGWSMFESFESQTMPAVDEREYEVFIDSTTFQLKQADPLVKHCFFAGSDYEKAINNYGRAINDPTYLGFNILYHADKLYENTLAIIERFKMGLGGQDSAYYQRLGRNIGLIVFWSFYDIEDFSYPDISLTWSSDFDEEIELDWDFDSMI